MVHHLFFLLNLTLWKEASPHQRDSTTSSKEVCWLIRYQICETLEASHITGEAAWNILFQGSLPLNFLKKSIPSLHTIQKKKQQTKPKTKKNKKIIKPICYILSNFFPPQKDKKDQFPAWSQLVRTMCK